MNDLVRYDPKTGTVILPATVRAAIEHYRSLPAFLRSSWVAPHRPEAADLAQALAEERDRPAPGDVIAEWLMKLEDAVVPTLNADQLRDRINVTIAVLGRLPAFCWTDQTFAAVARKQKFFPTVSELADHLQPICDRHQEAITLLRRMADAPVPAPIAEAQDPYPVQPAPEWATQRSTRNLARKWDAEDIQPPERTREEQLRALGFDAEGKPL